MRVRIVPSSPGIAGEGPIHAMLPDARWLRPGDLRDPVLLC